MGIFLINILLTVAKFQGHCSIGQTWNLFDYEKCYTWNFSFAGLTTLMFLVGHGDV